jgi:hypothetical protein
MLSWATRATAFCPSRTCRPKLETCESRGEDCVVTGKELFRKSSCVTFNVQQDGSRRHDIDAALFEQIVRDAFDRWLGADCGAGRHPALEVESLGTAACGEVQCNCSAGNANIFMFSDDEWLAFDAADAYAVTTVWFGTSSGEIRDVDVEVNGTRTDIDWSEPREGVDLPSVLTHEVGHFLGLAHSPDDPSAVMRREFRPGLDDLRELRADDVAGICSVYPPDSAASSSSCAPRNGFASECGPGDCETCASVEAESGCCSTAPGRPGPQGAVAFLVAALAAAAALRKLHGKSQRSA